jgi:ribonuclease PH
MNVIMTENDGYVEVQGTAEDGPYSRAEMDAMLALAEKGIAELIELQRSVLGE